MKDRFYEMDKMKREGKTYREIGERFGLSKQRVYQILGKMDKHYFKPIKEKVVAYKGIRDWLNEKKISFTEFCRLIYGYYHPKLYTRLTVCLNKTHPIKIDMIEKILDITGLTYEQAFKELKNER